MSDTLDAKAMLQNLIDRKLAQIKHFEFDKTRPREDKSFTNDQYDEKIAKLKFEIADLEKQLNKPVSA